MNIIAHRKLFLGIAALLVAASIGSILVLGFRPSIEFTGGTLWQVRFVEREVPRGALATFLADELKVGGATVIEGGEAGVYLLRLAEVAEEDHARYREALVAKFGALEELSFQTIGAAVGGETRSRAVTAVVVVLVAISLYIAFAFRKVSQPVSSWKYGLITLVTLAHDALIPAGLFALLGSLRGVEVDVNFIVAILLVMGFSVHDTIVVFDRIREQLHGGGRGRGSFEDLVNASVNATLARSLNTSLTLVFVLVALLLFGAANLWYFILTILVGVAVGTYSSIFVASPLLTMWRKR